MSMHRISQEPIRRPPEVEPFVLDRLCYENADSRYFSNKYDHGDSTDMTANGYFQDDDGKIYMECMHDYLSLEYYNGRIDGKLRILKALSKYLKEEIPLDLLLNAYDIVMKEENLSKTKRYMNFLEQDLKDIGNMKTARILKESVPLCSIVIVCRIVNFENYLLDSVPVGEIKSVDNFEL